MFDFFDRRQTQVYFEQCKKCWNTFVIYLCAYIQHHTCAHYTPVTPFCMSLLYNP